jgi:hypothetical protein
MQQCIKDLLFLVLNEAQHVSGDTLPIIRSLKLHKQSLVLHVWKVVGHCRVAYATWQRPITACPTAFYACKTRGCLCSFRLLMMGGVSPETCWASFKMRNNKTLIHCCILVVFFCKIILSQLSYHTDICFLSNSILSVLFAWLQDYISDYM